MPTIDGSFQVPAGRTSSGTRHVWGTLAGRDPGRYSELVLVAVDLDTAAPLAATLETARRLARQAAFDQVPERSVMVALLGSPRTGVLGLQDFAARPPWALDAVQQVFYVSADSSRAQAVRDGAPPLGAPVDVLTTPASSKTGSARFFTSARSLASATLLADTLYTALVAASVPAPDTLDVPAP